MKYSKIFLLIFTSSLLTNYTEILPIPSIQKKQNLENKTRSIPELPLCRETEHLAFYCVPSENAILSTTIEQCESLLTQLSIEFNHTYTSKMTFKIYPTIADFHESISWPDTPNWICGKADLVANQYSTVSPNNPGAYHSPMFIMSRPLYGLVELFINNKYPNCNGWLFQGICINKFPHTYSEYRLALLAKKDPKQLPTLQQITDTCIANDTLEFNRITGPDTSGSLVKFITNQWGREAVDALATNYSNFQLILGISEEELRTLWLEYLHQAYPN